MRLIKKVSKIRWWEISVSLSVMTDNLDITGKPKIISALEVNLMKVNIYLELHLFVQDDSVKI